MGIYIIYGNIICMEIYIIHRNLYIIYEKYIIYGNMYILGKWVRIGHRSCKLTLIFMYILLISNLYLMFVWS